MASMNQIKNGLVMYIDREILPHLSGMKKVGLGVYSALAAENLEKTLHQYKNHPAVAMLGLIDEDGEIDISKLYKAAEPYFSNGEKHRLNIPLIGEIVLGKEDLDTLYRLANR